MKKTLIVAICLGYSITTNAQQMVNQTETEMLAFNNPSTQKNEINLHMSELNANNQSFLGLSSTSLSDMYIAKKKKSKLKPWHYIVGGAAILVIGTVAILAPKGVSSRDGVIQ